MTDVSNQILNMNISSSSSCNKIARKPNQTKTQAKDSESKKREDLTSLGSDDSGIEFIL